MLTTNLPSRRRKHVSQPQTRHRHRHHRSAPPLQQAVRLQHVAVAVAVVVAAAAAAAVAGGGAVVVRGRWTQSLASRSALISAWEEGHAHWKLKGVYMVRQKEKRKAKR